MICAFLVCQFVVVILIALHDWVPLGKLNNLQGIRTADTTRRVIFVTTLSTLPYAVASVASAYYAKAYFRAWLLWLLWLNYGIGLCGMLRTWWVPPVPATFTIASMPRFEGHFPLWSKK